MTDFGELEMGFKHDAAGNHEIVGKITLIDSSPLSSHGGSRVPTHYYQFFVSMLTYPHSHIQYDLSDHHPKSNVHS
jgi:hypothetical protein